TSSFTLLKQRNVPLNWSVAKASLRPANIPAAAWDVIYANFLADAGSTEAQFENLLDREATYLSQLGEYTPDESRLLQLEFAQAGDFGAVAQRNTLGALGYGVAEPHG